MNTRGFLLVTLAIVVIAIPSTASAGRNPYFTVPLHAMEGIATSCQDYLPVDCELHHPVVDIPPDQITTVFVLVYNHVELTGLQTAFDWGPYWSLVFGQFTCQINQLSPTTPANPGGPIEGRLVTAFDCVTDTALQVIGYMVFDVGPLGCLRHVNPGPVVRPIAALDCDFQRDEIDANSPQHQYRLGRICVGSGGNGACRGSPTPVESVTWGKIKTTYW